MLFVSSKHNSPPSPPTKPCFNLGIEMLFVSRILGAISDARDNMFQSRNRDAFRFKRLIHFASQRAQQGFNLGIEMLFVSRLDPQRRMIETQESFNLGIEMLFVSRRWSRGLIQAVRCYVSISESRCFSFQV